MSSIWTVQFWKDAAERAIKTFAYTTVAALPIVGAISDVAVLAPAANAGAYAALLSVLGSVGSSLSPWGNGSASLTNAVELVPAKQLDR